MNLNRNGRGSKHILGTTPTLYLPPKQAEETNSTTQFYVCQAIHHSP
jgi:hypothetical protein